MPWRIRPIVLMTLLVLGTFASLFPIQYVRASGATYIRADGSIDPPEAPISTADNVSYTLTGNIASDADGIVVERDGIAVDGAGYTVTGSVGGDGIMLVNRRNVVVRNMTTTNFEYGIFLDSSSDNTFSGNNASNNTFGIALHSSSNCSLVGNDVTVNNQWGIGLGSSSNNTFSGNNITNNGHGIWLYSSSNNTFSGNNVTANYGYGIVLESSSSNTLFDNDVTANILCGVYINGSSDNKFYRNNFVANTQQVLVHTESAPSANVWDDGPSGGNYWSDYNGTDANQDGIGDTPYTLDANNADHYPLMNPIPADTTPPTITDVSQTPTGTVVTPADEVKVNATVTDTTSGVKKVILEYATNDTQFVSIDMTKLEGDIYNATVPAFPLGTNVTYLIMAEDMNNNTVTTKQLGFTYQYQVIPEFPSFLILASFMIVTLISVSVCRKTRARTRARTISGC